MVNLQSFFHCRKHVKPCLHCNKTHGINSQSKCKRYLRNEYVHYMTKKIAHKFEHQGTGIGLYMTKSIIETNMKGKIEVENIDDGVKFIITLNI